MRYAENKDMFRNQEANTEMKNQEARVVGRVPGSHCYVTFASGFCRSFQDYSFNKFEVFWAPGSRSPCLRPASTISRVNRGLWELLQPSILASSRIKGFLEAAASLSRPHLPLAPPGPPHPHVGAHPLSPRGCLCARIRGSRLENFPVTQPTLGGRTPQSFPSLKRAKAVFFPEPAGKPAGRKGGAARPGRPRLALGNGQEWRWGRELATPPLPDHLAAPCPTIPIIMTELRSHSRNSVPGQPGAVTTAKHGGRDGQAAGDGWGGNVKGPGCY
nr:uncharacterized protein LOC111750048 [Loxodonta africana]